MRAIYNAWATGDEIRRWFLASAEYSAPTGERRGGGERAEAGDAYLWTWHGYADGSPERGSIVTANGHDHFGFTFADDCVVDVMIKNEEGEKVVELTQTNIAPDEDRHIYVGCGEGWTFYLANLKSVLEGGIDLRNKNDRIRSVVNA